MKNHKRISKLLSLVLRHKPDKIGVSLDPAGWADVENLLTGLQEIFPDMTRDTLEWVVAKNDKQRFRFDASGERIRASQGHSVPVDLGLEACEPPEMLLHGTVSNCLESIFKEEGLIRGERHHVHLSEDVEKAEDVGSRRGKPVLLEVASGQMHADGYSFYQSDNGVWLTEQVPVRYLRRGERREN